MTPTLSTITEAHLHELDERAMKAIEAENHPSVVKRFETVAARCGKARLARDLERINRIRKTKGHAAA